MRMSGTGAMKTRSDARRVMGFGKRWKSGETHMVGYPIFFDENNEPQILVGATWGHKMDPKALAARKIFWPSHSEIIDGKPKVADLAYQAARIMPLVLKGAYAAEVQKVEASSSPNSWKKSALKEIDKTYEVDDEGRIGKSPAIGRLTYIVTTEIVDIPLLQDMSPNVKECRVVSQDLSDEKLRALRNLMLNPDYAPKAPEGDDEGDKVFWVQYAFGTTGEKKLDGRVAPTGYNKGYLLQERYPEAYAKLLNDIESLPTETESIMKRNSVFAKGDERDLLSAFQTYWILNEDKLNGLTDDTDLDRLKKVAKVIKSLNVPVTNPVLVEAIAELEVEEKSIPTTISADPNVAESTAPTMEGLIEDKDIEDAISESGQDEDASADINSEAGNFAAMADS